MKAVFFSDAHLLDAEGESGRVLMRFLRGVTRGLDHLFVVGDLFDFWFARGPVVYPGFRPVIEELASMQGRGVQVHLFEGNHDFYLADYFERVRGFEVFPDEALLDLDGRQVYVAHGDRVDPTDKGYRMLRRVLRSPFFYGLQKRLPLALLWKLARRSSAASKEYLAKPQEGLAAKMESFAMTKFSEGADAVILGHCHLPVLKTTTVGGRRRDFSLLGDWLGHRSYLVLDSGRFDLCFWGETGSR